MAKKQLVEALVDLEFDGSTNKFEEFYGDTISYQQVEQDSYIEFKMMVNEFIGKVKFRKAREISRPSSLTCRLTMDEAQYSLFEAIYQGETIDEEKSTEEQVVYKRFFFLHDFKICNVRLNDENNPEEKQ
ncbi:MAG: hypothetical protein P8J32_00155 [bacterium]|nr:hypothetical protein [bacterium]